MTHKEIDHITVWGKHPNYKDRQPALYIYTDDNGHYVLENNHPTYQYYFGMLEYVQKVRYDHWQGRTYFYPEFWLYLNDDGTISNGNEGISSGPLEYLDWI